jgi:hypothetical protein
MSYITPYTIIGISAGSTLWWLTDKPQFIAIFGIAGVGFGMLRNTNIKHNTNTKQGSSLSNLTSFGLKALTIWVLGPSLLTIGTISLVLVALK